MPNLVLKITDRALHRAYSAPDRAFYRVDKARSRQTGGSGLGLAIVKHAVNHHESRLNIESTVGKGTRFSFIIPERLIAKTAINSPLSSFIAISQPMLAYFLLQSKYGR